MTTFATPQLSEVAGSKDRDSSFTTETRRTRRFHWRQRISLLLSRRSLVSWKEFCLADFLAFLASWRLMLIRKFNRQGAKDAKLTPSKTIWLRQCCSANLSVLRD